MYATKYWRGESCGKSNIDRTHKFDIIHPKRVKYCAIQLFAYIGVLDLQTPPTLANFINSSTQNGFYRNAYNSFLVFMTVSRKAALKNFSTIKLVVKWLSMQRFMNIQKR